MPVKRLLAAGSGVLLLALALALLLYSGLPDPAIYSRVFLSGDARPVAPELNALAPPFSLPTLDQGALAAHLTLQDLRGQVVVLNFWATWCAPCAFEMPELQAFYERHSATVRLLGVNMGETAAVAQSWVTRFGLSFPLLLDQDQTVASLYRLRVQPSTFIIAPDGTITHIFFGAITQSALEGAIAPFLSN